MKRLYNSLIISCMLLLATPASAALIEQWSFENSAGFISWQAAGVTPSGASNYLDDDNNLQTWYSTLTWGAPFEGGPLSSFSITSPINGTIMTNGATQFGTPLVHNNFPILDNGQLLTQAVLLDKLLLTPLVPAGPALDAPTITFDIRFFETVNAPGAGILCPDGNPQGIASNINGCGDIFAIASPFDLVQSFILDGYLYTINIGIIGGDILPDAACSELSFASGCYGFVTIENASNTILPFFSITARPFNEIPEPAGLALFGIGLLLLRRLGARQ
ncbi:THxN family PEP-CTERM protein [Arsukibacterium sp.]|uniref:THxN family PEP-CTERM protein n=1 Tax=Arsukibacterium sp. TaxID=1977258 RepID=UPI002FD8A5DF